MTDLTAPRLTAVALVDAWLDDRVTAFDVPLPDEDDADPLRDLGATIGGLVVLAGSLAELAARTQGADDVTQGAHELLDVAQ
jgi:hypothetical protein